MHRLPAIPPTFCRVSRHDTKTSPRGRLLTCSVGQDFQVDSPPPAPSYRLHVERPAPYVTVIHQLYGLQIGVLFTSSGDQSSEYRKPRLCHVFLFAEQWSWISQISDWCIVSYRNHSICSPQRYVNSSTSILAHCVAIWRSPDTNPLRHWP